MAEDAHEEDTLKGVAAAETDNATEADDTSEAKRAEPSADYQAGFDAAREELSLILATPGIANSRNRKAAAAELWADRGMAAHSLVSFVTAHVSADPTTSSEQSTVPGASGDDLATSPQWH